MNAILERPILPIFYRAEIERRNVAKEIALRTLGELVVATALGAICALFIAPASISILVAGIAFQTILSLAIRVALAVFDGNAFPPSAKWLAPAAFAAGSDNIHTLIHEAGHAFAAHALLENPSPRIELFPFTGGVTSFKASTPSPLGQKIGIQNIQPLVSGAGPLVSLTVSSGMLCTGLGLLDRSPEEGRMLIVSAMIDFLSHAIYAFSALFANPANFSHDFVSLSAAGIHPIVSTIAIISIPTLILIGNHYLTRN